MNHQKVKQWFEESLRLDANIPAELKGVLLRGHPKVNNFIDYLVLQIKSAQAKCAKRGKRLQEKTAQEFVYDVTKFFWMGLDMEAKRRYESDLERIKREEEKAKLEEFDRVLAGEQVGEFAEAGLITNEALDKERENQDAQKTTGAHA